MILVNLPDANLSKLIKLKKIGVEGYSQEYVKRV